jgi:hypothetical protein
VKAPLVGLQAVVFLQAANLIADVHLWAVAAD